MEMPWRNYEAIVLIEERGARRGRAAAILLCTRKRKEMREGIACRFSVRPVLRQPEAFSGRLGCYAKKDGYRIRREQIFVLVGLDE